MRDKLSKLWIPLYVDKWIFGSTRIELEPDERGVFVDLMALAAKDDGFIRANEVTPYPPRQLAGLLNIPEELLSRTLKKCIEFDKIGEAPPGIYRLLHWEKYQFTDRWKREIAQKPELSTKKTLHDPLGQRFEGAPVSLHPPTSAKTEATSQNAEAIKENKRKQYNIVKERKERGGCAHPSLDEVKIYCRERGNSVNPDKWLSHYEANGWRVGKNPMKDWKAAVRIWEYNNFGDSPPATEKKSICYHSDGGGNPWEHDPDSILKGGKSNG